VLIESINSPNLLRGRGRGGREEGRLQR